MRKWISQIVAFHCNWYIGSKFQINDISLRQKTSRQFQAAKSIRRIPIIFRFADLKIFFTIRRPYFLKIIFSLQIQKFLQFLPLDLCRIDVLWISVKILRRARIKKNLNGSNLEIIVSASLRMFESKFREINLNLETDWRHDFRNTSAIVIVGQREIRTGQSAAPIVTLQFNRTIANYGWKKIPEFIKR